MKTALSGKGMYEAPPNTKADVVVLGAGSAAIFERGHGGDAADANDGGAAV